MYAKSMVLVIGVGCLLYSHGVNAQDNELQVSTRKVESVQSEAQVPDTDVSRVPPMSASNQYNSTSTRPSSDDTSVEHPGDKTPESPGSLPTEQQADEGRESAGSLSTEQQADEGPESAGSWSTEQQADEGPESAGSLSTEHQPDESSDKPHSTALWWTVRIVAVLFVVVFCVVVILLVWYWYDTRFDSGHNSMGGSQPYAQSTNEVHSGISQKSDVSLSYNNGVPNNRADADANADADNNKTASDGGAFPKGFGDVDVSATKHGHAVSLKKNIDQTDAVFNTQQNHPEVNTSTNKYIYKLLQHAEKQQKYYKTFSEKLDTIQQKMETLNVYVKNIAQDLINIKKEAEITKSAIGASSNDLKGEIHSSLKQYVEQEHAHLEEVQHEIQGVWAEKIAVLGSRLLPLERDLRYTAVDKSKQILSQLETALAQMEHDLEPILPACHALQVGRAPETAVGESLRRECEDYWNRQPEPLQDVVMYTLHLQTISKELKSVIATLDDQCVAGQELDLIYQRVQSLYEKAEGILANAVTLTYTEAELTTLAEQLNAFLIPAVERTYLRKATDRDEQDQVSVLAHILEILGLELIDVKAGDSLNVQFHSVVGARDMGTRYAEDSIISVVSMCYRDKKTGQVNRAEVVVNRRKTE